MEHHKKLNFVPNFLDQPFQIYFQNMGAFHIIVKLIRNLSINSFRINQDLMKNYKIPSFADLFYCKSPEESTCSPYIKFTTNAP
ncbi:hypothetical protein VP01_1030g4 [Puccinia sorghi]|uniref:Tet-like 2OG-Fe(II) oxygenase domain-containing protein n=1 Tax=Puccinia sorghi TaxID=27349 RepID=A0A0L6VVZ4_9BASI|nr:hypothetical protein VP01_1030g4 [Puccinia sorghi]